MNPDDFFHGKIYVVRKLRTIVADGIRAMHPEDLLNFVLAQRHAEDLENKRQFELHSYQAANTNAHKLWYDEWSQLHELSRSAFAFLIHSDANVVEAVGPNEGGRPEDLVIRFSAGAIHHLHAVPDGLHGLHVLRNRIRMHYQHEGNCHWGMQTDIAMLSEALHLGIIVFTNRAQ